MGERALRKKMIRKVKVGDVVTWGNRVSSCVVLEVHQHGVVVDAADQGFPSLLVSWDGGTPGRGSGISPIEVVGGKPGKLPKPCADLSSANRRGSR